VEADSFWCLTKLLDGIQDNYIFAQPGIQRQVAALRDLVHRIDAPLTNHLASQGVEFIQFSFRWMNCMLMREVSVKNTIRMWDTYMVCCSPLLGISTNMSLVRGYARLLRFSSICLCCFSCQMDGSNPKDGVPGHYDVLASFTDPELG
jgi:hypothetical protein